MLFYKAWRESESRFALSVVTLAIFSVAFVIFHNDGAAVSDRPLTYVEYIWRAVYKGYLRELFIILALLLGVGGLLREQEQGTTGFTLALPVMRYRFAFSRALVGFLEVIMLAAVPAIVIPAVSPLVAQAYPWLQSFQFWLLWCVGGAFIYALGFLASNLFSREYVAPVAAFLVLLAYSALADTPFAEQYPVDVHDVMSGLGMPYFRARDSILIGPLPWVVLLGFTFAALCLVILGHRLVRHRDF